MFPISHETFEDVLNFSEEKINIINWFHQSNMEIKNTRECRNQIINKHKHC